MALRARAWALFVTAASLSVMALSTSVAQQNRPRS